MILTEKFNLIKGIKNTLEKDNYYSMTILYRAVENILDILIQDGEDEEKANEFLKTQLNPLIYVKKEEPKVEKIEEAIKVGDEVAFYDVDSSQWMYGTLLEFISDNLYRIRLIGGKKYITINTIYKIINNTIKIPGLEDIKIEKIKEDIKVGDDVGFYDKFLNECIYGVVTNISDNTYYISEYNGRNWITKGPVFNFTPKTHIHKKVYSNNVLLSSPPKLPWICSICGEKGINSESYPAEETYDDIVKRFNKEVN